ncbi:major outer membrane lipoprotein [Pantoea sp. Aalb]|uniref:major outer membrane lipoprotein n=1 Tax=Pantoea sp. Aalb TaxID=2576762 RepID=UPI00132B59BC|nr:major outer membrane lipoprotein [Pantoea sp. Aalb]MXP67423.1 major outer membrane lipoprotein [Pantoea sp. Aalb]
MNFNKSVIGAMIISSILLSGCSKSAKLVDQLSSNVQTLHAKVDELSNDVSAMRAELQSTKNDASRANQRLDNQTHLYRK